MPLSLSAVLFGYELHGQHALRALLALRAMCEPCATQLVTDALPTQPLTNGYFVKVQGYDITARQKSRAWMTAHQSRGRANMWQTLLAQAEGWKSCCASSKGSTRTTPSLLPASRPA
jgi:hypothetical protein